MWSLPTILWGERQVRPWRPNLIQAVTGAGVHSWGAHVQVREGKLMNLDCVAYRFTEGGGSGSVGALLLADLQLQRFYTPLHLSQSVVKTLQQLFETWRDKSLIDLKASSVSSQSFCFFFVCVCLFVAAGYRDLFWTTRWDWRCWSLTLLDSKLNGQINRCCQSRARKPPPSLNTDPSTAPSLDRHLHLPDATSPISQPKSYEGETNLGNDK